MSAVESDPAKKVSKKEEKVLWPREISQKAWEQIEKMQKAEDEEEEETKHEDEEEEDDDEYIYPV